MNSYRTVDVLCESPNADSVEQLLDNTNVIRWWLASNDKHHNGYRVLVKHTELQQVLDTISDTIYHLPGGNIIVNEVEAVYPEPKTGESEDNLYYFGGLTREELRANVESGAQLNLNYLVLLGLSTIVAAIGLHTGDIAAVIGAMVIAPMLQSNIAFSFGITVGDMPLMRRALKVNAIGFLLAFTISYCIGSLWPNGDEWNDVLLARANIEYSHLVLALAAGAAAVLSLTAGVSSALVGVMVSVALLPPLAAAGLLAGQGDWMRASDALALAFANALCINIAAKIVFQLKKIKPGWDGDAKTAQSSLRISYSIAFIMLLGIIALIYFSTEKIN